ncbi:hypothetical protein KQX54_012743 [Cotesia glomerata]|uniref:Uncharacterized protein n=1 Tax=Cotesia glomerata TaxID=32391 RepID=A0AAV7J5Z6_COTGL|nr:hypothetical protein KQX54_012743 [Cotesia glomerata]
MNASAAWAQKIQDVGYSGVAWRKNGYIVRRRVQGICAVHCDGKIDKRTGRCGLESSILGKIAIEPISNSRE